MEKEGTIVIAVESLKNGLLKSYGKGKYLGERVPNAEPFKSGSIKNPCIQLDQGGYAWGFQCWWGEADAFMKKYESGIKSTEIVKPQPVEPLEVV